MPNIRREDPTSLAAALRVEQPDIAGSIDKGIALGWESKKNALQKRLAEAGLIKVTPSLQETGNISGVDLSQQNEIPLKSAIGLADQARRLNAPPKPQGPSQLQLDALAETIRHNKASESLSGDRNKSAPSKGQSETDKIVGKSYGEAALGGNVVTGQNLQDLENIAGDLTSGKVNTGGILGSLLPENAQRVVAKDLANTRQRIQTVVFPTLRLIMGAAFTAEEGQRVIAATFDTAQPSEVNAQRALRLKTVLQNQLALKKQALDYFGKNGTLQGYQLPGKLEVNADDIIGALNQQSAQGGVSDKESQEISKHLGFNLPSGAKITRIQ